jgi:hypothetical protein
MTKVLRVLAFLLGCAVVVAPPFFVLSLAYSLGEPPEDLIAFLMEPVLVGLIFGAGPLMIGLPSLVAGGKRPIIRAIAAALLGVSMAGFIVLGIEGSVTLIVTPLALLLEALLFASFIWPAPRFPEAARRQGVAA